MLNTQLEGFHWLYFIFEIKEMFNNENFKFKFKTKLQQVVLLEKKKTEENTLKDYSHA